MDYVPLKKKLEYASNLQCKKLIKSWIKSSETKDNYISLSKLVISSRILDSVDPQQYSYLMKEKPKSLDPLIKAATTFC